MTSVRARQVSSGPFDVPSYRRFIKMQTHRIGCAPPTNCLLGGE
jgi:hypothetical protein